jgi:DNA-binding HxlR family transcriptional regulator
MQLQKITNAALAASAGRSYQDACGAAHALDLVGERWALLVIRELMLGPKRFGELRADLPAISANVLTQRLEGLEAAGILTKHRLPPPASAQVYELTAWGYESEPIFQTLGRWAARSPLHDPTLPFSAVSLFLSFRTMFDAHRAGGVAATVGFEIGPHTYRVTIGEGRLTAERGDLDSVGVVFAGPAPVIAAVVYGGHPIGEMQAAGALMVKGDLALAAWFVTLFPLPPKVA